MPRVVEAVSLGAALLATLGINAYADLASAADAMVRIEKRIEPDPARVESYAKMFDTYQSLYPALRETNWRLRDLARS